MPDHTHHWADIQPVTSLQIYRGNLQRALPKFIRGGNHANTKVKKTIPTLVLLQRKSRYCTISDNPRKN